MLNPTNTGEQMGSWLNTAVGRAFMGAEDKVVTQHIANLFGYHLLMMGAAHFASCLHATKICHQIHLDPLFSGTSDLSFIQGRIDKLPLVTESIDVAYVPHVLEFTDNPHEVLREVYRVLYPEGHLILTSFNPFSFFGGWKLAKWYSKRVPWHGHFYPLYKIKDWLNLLGFDIFAVQHFFFRMPINQATWLKSFEFCDKIGSKLSLPLGGGFLILASKRVASMTPLIPRWQVKESLVAGGDLVEPSTRG